MLNTTRLEIERQTPAVQAMLLRYAVRMSLCLLLVSLLLVAALWVWATQSPGARAVTQSGDVFEVEVRR